MSDSASGGFLIPVPGPGREAEEDELHDLIAALCGLPGHLVRPRWQAEPPRQPEPGTDWCAFGVIGRDAPGSQTRHERGRDGQGRSVVETHETLDILASFYGPHAQSKAVALREGLHVEQNRAELRARANLALVRAGAMTAVPELVLQRWVQRQDLPLTFRRGPLPGTDEGGVDVRHIAEARACGLCALSR